MKKATPWMLAIFLLLLVGGCTLKEKELMPYVLILAALVSAVTLVNTHFGLSILIFSMLFSPEFEISAIRERAVAFRVDDILLFAVFFTWLAKVALFKRVGLLKRTPLNSPIMVFIGCCLVSTTLGVMTGSAKSKSAFFFILKYVEYFFVYFMFVNSIESKKQLKLFLKCALITCFFVCLYTFSRYGKEFRISAPFEGETSEPASLGGYLLLMWGVVLGLWAYAETRIEKFSLGAFLLLIPAALAISTSRGSYIGVPPMYLTVLFLTKRKKLLFLFFLLISPLLFSYLMPARIVEFIEEGFQGDAVQIGTVSVPLGYSGTSRVSLWVSVFERLKKNPLLGLGITGLGLVDNHYIRILGETGIIGVSVFFWLLLRIWMMGYRQFSQSEDNFYKGLGLGFLGGFVGVFGLGMTANSFIIVRIMEPFWFFAAAVSVIPYLTEVSREKEEVLPS